jgi:hypothetical protein
MKRLQISLEPELDERLGEMAREEGVSKAEVVRRSLRKSIELPPRLVDDPIFQLFGTGTGEGRKPGETIDDILYGPVEALGSDRQDLG